MKVMYGTVRKHDKDRRIRAVTRNRNHLNRLLLTTRVSNRASANSREPPREACATKGRFAIIAGSQLSTDRQRNIPVSGMTLPHCTFRHANPILDGVPFPVIPNQQIRVGAIGAFDWGVLCWGLSCDLKTSEVMRALLLLELEETGPSLHRLENSGVPSRIADSHRSSY
jgi:hypothetical protein